jgi:cell division protein FtsW (lipid II flippase)
MLQRIQTLFFATALICIAIPLFGFTLFTLTTNQIEISVDAFRVNGANYSQNHFFWLILVFTMLLLVGTLFSYKNRKTQMKLGWASLIMLFVLTAWIMVSIFFNPAYANTEKSIGFGFVALIVALPLIYIGIRGVKKDQALIDSLNRLR